MNENDVFSKLPDAVKYGGVAGGYIAAAILFLRQWLSQAKVDRTATEANVATITRLQAERDSERERADQLMHEREAMVAELGELRAKVEMLSTQVEDLKTLIREYRDAARKAAQ